ncbi:hypothetical protein K9L67_00645 [Candidatus Woesearchaeota archaeon]|nr:hypothetical protein [Candidatus Woesearchaeota archaeon]MCF7900715.1 hypothetical protein [Candidatus Woesearchaeota archaeon]MCF8013236.1 hypothetical protein [Candidatus Woesearchaeota archaeon]
MLGKKAWSPIFTTIVLIGFAVALGTMIMNWGSNAVMTGPSCDRTKIEFQKIQGGDAICFSQETKELRFIIMNSGKSLIDSILYRNIKPNFKVSEFNLDESSIDSSEVYSASFKYDFGSNVQIEFIPSIKTKDGRESCSSKSLMVSELTFCTD